MVQTSFASELLKYTPISIAQAAIPLPHNHFYQIPEHFALPYPHVTPCHCIFLHNSIRANNK